MTESNDPRSYRINSDKLLATGYKPKKTVEHAVQEIIESYRSGVLKDEDHFYNLKWMEKDENCERAIDYGDTYAIRINFAARLR